MFRLEHGARILFAGDGVTDCGCSSVSDINFLGHGYPIFIDSLLGVRAPEMEFRCINTAVSGERSCDLAARWKNSVIEQKPDAVSILTGINDTVSRYTINSPTDADEYHGNLRSILDMTRDALPETSIMLLEPFMLPVPEEKRVWRVDLDEKIQVVRDLASEYGAALLPLDGIFAEAACRREKTFWLRDGIHPTAAGHALIAEHWLSAAGFGIR